MPVELSDIAPTNLGDGRNSTHRPPLGKAAISAAELGNRSLTGASNDELSTRRTRARAAKQLISRLQLVASVELEPRRCRNMRANESVV